MSRTATATTAKRKTRSSASTPDRDDFERSFDLTRNPIQADFIYTLYQFAFYVGGVGAGKTFAGALRGVIAALSLPGSVGLVVAPTYQMLEDATLKEFFANLPPACVLHWNDQKKHLWLVNGSEVLFRSADNPERFRGFQVAWAWLDEAPYCGHYAWELAKARLRQPGYPGWMWATGTPRGKDGYWRDFESPKRQPGHKLYRASTLANAHNLPAQYIRNLRNAYSDEMYKQEVLGLFTAFEGLVYNVESDPTVPGSHVREAGTRRIRAFSRVIGGIDWGFRNPAVALPIGIDNDDRAWILDEFYKAGVPRVAPPDKPDAESVIGEIVRLTRRYRVETWYADSEDPESIEALRGALARAHLSCTVVEADKAIIPGIATVQSMLQLRGDNTRGLYVSEKCAKTLVEFGQYQYPTKSQRNRNPDEKPDKQYDHGLDALRYALHTEFSRRNKGRRFGDFIDERLAVRQQHEEAEAAAEKDDWY